MYNIYKKIILAIIAIFSIFLIGCNEPEARIELSKKGKTEYYVGEMFDPTDYVLKVSIDDKTKEIDLKLEMTNITKEFDEAGEKIISVNYKEEDLELNTSFKVNVINKRVLSIKVKESGKILYDLNQSFDESGFILEVKYEDDTTKEIQLTKEMIESDLDSTTEGEKEVRVKYQEGASTVYCNILVNVEEFNNIVNFELIETGKNYYNLNEDFNLEGYKFEAEYEDGTTEEIALTEEMIKSEIDFSTIGEKEITIEYTKYDITKTVTLVVNVVEKAMPVALKISEYGETIYTYEMAFSLNGYKFEVEYSDGTVKEIDNDLVLFDEHIYDENYEDYAVIVNIPVSCKIDGVNLTLTIETSNIAEWDYEEYVGKRDAEIMVAKIYADLQAIIPTETSENIPLPESTAYGIKYILRFSTSNTMVLSPRGVIEQREEDVIVQIKVTIDNDYIKETYTWDVNVKGLGPVQLRPWIETEKHIFAYFYEGTSSVMTEKDAQKVDVINYCFARVTGGLCDISGLRNLKENLKLRRSTGVRIVLSVGGGGTGSLGFSDACYTDENRAKFVESMVTIVKDYGFDGIDLDWEYPAWTGLSDSRPEDKDNFTKLCKELRVALDAYKPGLLLTSACIGGQNVGRFYDLPELNKYLDYVHLMTYDLNSSGLTTHHSNTYPGGRAYSAKNAMENYMSGGIDSEKLIIGAAFYGKISTLATPTTASSAVLLKPIAKTEDGKDDTKTIQFSKIKQDYLNNPNFVRLYDESAGAYYLTDGKVFITYDDPEIFSVKCNLIKAYNLGGIMFWDYGSDNTGTLLNRLWAEVEEMNQGR